MKELTTKRADEIRELASLNIKEILATLPEGKYKKVLTGHVFDALKVEVKRLVDIYRVNYDMERGKFLKSLQSDQTRREYAAQLARLDAWAAMKGLAAIEMKPRDADDFIMDMRADGRAPSSVNLTIAAASAFFTFLERRHDHIRNPFRGTKARPKKKAVRETTIPTAEELGKIIEALSGPYRAAAVIMARRGLRVGALPSLSIRDGRFKANSKGKDITGDMPEECIKATRAAGLELARPFAGISAEKIKDHFRYITRKLAKAGELGAAYSVHDLRHAYAVERYRADKDIYALKQALGHASIQVTELYLKGLGAA